MTVMTKDDANQLSTKEIAFEATIEAMKADMREEGRDEGLSRHGLDSTEENMVLGEIAMQSLDMHSYLEDGENANYLAKLKDVREILLKDKVDIPAFEEHLKNNDFVINDYGTNKSFDDIIKQDSFDLVEAGHSYANEASYASFVQSQSAEDVATLFKRMMNDMDNEVSLERLNPELEQ